jgi:hypothetical protein
MPQKPYEDSFEETLELFSALGAAIPPEFWEILKIARVIFTPGNDTSDALLPLFESVTPRDDGPRTEIARVQVTVRNPNDPQPVYRRIQGVEELHLLDPATLAVEEFAELVAQAEEKKLAVRIMDPRERRENRDEIRPVRTSHEGKLLNLAAQKLYLLLDRSYSMRESSRLLFAKALLVEYLRIKRTGDSKMFFRAFDMEPYELLETQTRDDYDRVLKAVMLSEPGRKGTDIQAAILKAAEDIGREGAFSGAEIVLVTDGVDRLDVEKVRAALGGSIKLHTFKLGFDCQEPVEAEIKDLQEQEHLPRDAVIKFFQDGLRKQFIEVSTSFVEIPDLNGRYYHLEPEAFAHVRRSVENLALSASSGALTGEQRAELYRRAAFLADFVQFVRSDLQGAPGKDEERRAIDEAHAKLGALMDALLADTETVLRIGQIGSVHLVSSDRVKKRAGDAGLKLPPPETLEGDIELALALGWTKSKSGGGPTLSLADMAKLAWRAVAGRFRKKR